MQDAAFCFGRKGSWHFGAPISPNLNARKASRLNGAEFSIEILRLPPLNHKQEFGFTVSHLCPKASPWGTQSSRAELSFQLE